MVTVGFFLFVFFFIVLSSQSVKGIPPLSSMFFEHSLFNAHSWGCGSSKVGLSYKACREDDEPFQFSDLIAI